MKTTSFEPKQAGLIGPYPRPVPYYLGHILVYLGCLLLVLVLGWLILKAARVYTSYRTINERGALIETALADWQAGVAPLDPVQLQADGYELALALTTLDEAATPFVPFAPYLQWLPGYGPDLSGGPHLLAAGHSLGQAGLILHARFAPLLAAEPAPLLPLLAQAESDLEQVAQLLQQAQVHLGQVEPASLSPQLAQRVDLLRQYVPAALSTVQSARHLPALLGAETPQTYLILTQNADELRPSGGYINTAGHIVLDQGQISEFVMQDSYAVDKFSADYPYPPYPIYEIMAADYWAVRDAGWSPDFPNSARTAIYLYALGQGVSAQGVIAVDQHALPYLLRVLEPLTVEGETVTSENVIELMGEHWAPQAGQTLDQAWWLQRKSFMLALAEALRTRFESDLKTINLALLGQALSEALAAKHILIYSEAPYWADFVAEKNWAGMLQPAQDDYLMVVEANLGFNKANLLVERTVGYQVDLAADGGGQAHLHLEYRHPAPPRPEPCRQEISYEPVYKQNAERCYWNYLRVIAPAAARLNAGPHITVAGQHLLRGNPTRGDIDVEPVGLDKVSWGQLFVLAPQETLALDYLYALPPLTAKQAGDHWKYRLYLQKQPGLLAVPVEVTINLPPQATLLKSERPVAQERGTGLTYSLDLQTDQAIEVWYDLP